MATLRYGSAMSFASIVGHESVISGLRTSYVKARVSHAYLFRGPVGVGKKLLAMAFAQLLNCENPSVGPDACGQCRSCRLLLDERHPDLNVVEPDGQFIKIDTIRQMHKSLRFKPVAGQWRITLIHQADRLHEAAANALLKTLEEPPQRNAFLLISAKPHSVLATIRSRCQQVRCSSLNETLVAQWLVKTHGTDPQQAAESAALSWGSIGHAEEFIDPERIALRDHWLGFLQESATMSPQQLMNSAQELASDRAQIPPVLNILRLAFRDVVIRAATGSNRQCSFSEGSRTLPSMPVASGLQSLQLIDESEEALLGNTNARLAMEHLLLSLRRHIQHGKSHGVAQ
jgi:DNA polymerase-3 subunit delta'